MMIEVEQTVGIRRPIADVYGFLSDASNEPKWHTDVLGVKRTSKGAGVAGSTYALEFKPMMGHSQGTMDVIEAKANQRLVTQIHFGPMNPRVTYTFAADGPLTTVTRRVEITPPGMMKLMPFMMKRMIRKKGDDFLAKLKAVLEP